MACVLIVDDSLLQRNTLSAFVQAAGHKARTASNGKEGLQAILTDPPDCLLLDMLMPEMDGMQLLETLQARGISIPTIVLTADVQEWMKIKCLELGAKIFLNKPAKQEEVSKALTSVLDSSFQEA